MDRLDKMEFDYGSTEYALEEIRSFILNLKTFLFPNCFIEHRHQPEQTEIKKSRAYWLTLLPVVPGKPTGHAISSAYQRFWLTLAGSPETEERAQAVFGRVDFDKTKDLATSLQTLMTDVNLQTGRTGFNMDIDGEQLSKEENLSRSSILNLQRKILSSVT